MTYSPLIFNWDLGAYRYIRQRILGAKMSQNATCTDVCDIFLYWWEWSLGRWHVHYFRVTLYTTELHNLIAHNLAAHYRATYNPATRWGTGSVVCVTRTGKPLHNLTSQPIIKVVLTLVQRRDDSTDVGATLGQPTLPSGQIAQNWASTPASSKVVCSSTVCY